MCAVIVPLEDYDLLIVCRAIGLIGFSTYVTAFTALSLGWLSSARPLYFGLTLTASICVLISMLVEFNLASALIQSFYVVISTFGILRRRPSTDAVTVQPDVASDALTKENFAIESEYSNERDWAYAPPAAPQPHLQSAATASHLSWPS